MSKHERHFPLSSISALHYGKLVYRSLLLLWAVLAYILNEPLHHMRFVDAEPRFRPLLLLVWLVFAVEMTLRFFPSRLESMGCQKQFAKNYLSTGLDRSRAALDTARQTLTVLLVWLSLNGVIGWLYLRSVIDDGILFLVSLFYSVADMICILFFCPFQTLFMKNRCCATCRIYNWDYLMMFTPLLFVRSLYTWSLAGMAALLFLRWEITVHRHPERFIEEFNANLRCENCQEKLCSHKKQLHVLWKTQRVRLQELRTRAEQELREPLSKAAIMRKETRHERKDQRL